MLVGFEFGAVAGSKLGEYGVKGQGRDISEGEISGGRAFRMGFGSRDWMESVTKEWWRFLRICL